MHHLAQNSKDIKKENRKVSFFPFLPASESTFLEAINVTSSVCYLTETCFIYIHIYPSKGVSLLFLVFSFCECINPFILFFTEELLVRFFIYIYIYNNSTVLILPILMPSSIFS